MAFLNTLQVEPIPGSDFRKLLVPLVYRVSGRGEHANKDIKTPRKFKTNYANIPRPLWWLFRPDAGDTRRAATLHDYLYSKHSGFTRAQADALFRVALKEDGASLFKRWMLWAGVRLGGWRYWNKGVE